MKHIMQEEKDDPKCQEFLSLHKLYAPAETKGLLSRYAKETYFESHYKSNKKHVSATQNQFQYLVTVEHNSFIHSFHGKKLTSSTQFHQMNTAKPVKNT